MARSLKTLRLEPIQETHLPVMLEIEKLSNSSPWSERSFRNEIDHPHGVMLAAVLDGEVVGYGGGWLVVDEIHITNVAVHPEARGLGIARRLMIELLTRAQQAGMSCSTLEVRVGNAVAIGLYESLGYRVTSRRKEYYPDNKEDAVVMWLYDLGSWEPVSR